MNKSRDHDKAFNYYQMCLDLRLKTLGSDHPSVAGTYNNIGITLIDKGEYDKAIEYFGMSIKIKQKIYGPNHKKLH